VVPEAAARRPGVSEANSLTYSAPTTPVKLSPASAGVNQLAPPPARPAVAARVIYTLDAGVGAGAGGGRSKVYGDFRSTVPGGLARPADSAPDLYTTPPVCEAEARRAKLAQLYQRLDEITSPVKDQ
jgi:hypothetical protein